MLTAALGIFAFLYPLRNLSYDLLFFGRDATPVEDVAIVYLDDASLTRFDSLDVDHLDRRFHADLIRQLNLRGVPLIAFDFLFDRPRKPEEDKALIEAAKSMNNVLLGATLGQAKDGGTDTIIVNAPFPDLRKVVEYGLVEGSGSDRFCRTLAVPFELPGKTIETLAWEAAQQRRASKLTDPHRIRWMNYYGPPGQITSVNFIGVLSNQTANVILTNTTTVFVGTSTRTGSIGSKGGDVFPTPYNIWTRSPLSSGTEVIATAYLNLLRGDWLERLPTMVELLLIGGFGGLSVWVLTRLRPWPAAGGALALAAGLTISAHLLTWNTQPHLWFPWVGMIVIQLPFAFAWSVLSHTGRLAEEISAMQKRLRQRPKRKKSEDAPKKQGGREIAPVSEPELPQTAAQSIPNHELLAIIGEGGFGKVWLARNRLLPDFFCAVKIVPTGTPELQGKFDRELRGLQKFTGISREHPGLVHILHVGQPEDKSCFFYIMEAADDQVSGPEIDPASYSPRTLHSELGCRQRLAVRECVDLGLALTSALQFLHEKELIHRDIKPSNIIYVRGTPKLADIGLVTDFPATGHKLTYAGTFGYLAPEGPGVLGDIFALGQVLKDAHRGLYRAETEEQTERSLIHKPAPEAVLLDQLTEKATAQDPAQRIQSAAEFHSALLELRALLDKFAVTVTKLP